MKKQYFVRPDAYFAVTGDLRHYVNTVEITGTPAFMHGFRAAFISDLHITDKTTRAQMEALAAGIKSMKPDILLMGGDYADEFDNALKLFDCLKDVVPPQGKYAVMGNNDVYEEPDYDAMKRIMADHDICLLINDAQTISVNGGRLCIAGVDEHLEGSPDSRGLYPASSGEDFYRILLSHYPCMPEIKPDLMLSGHTHGGQFNCLGITPFTIGFERLMTKKSSSIAISGLHDMDGAKLFVGKGVGASRLQLRIGVRPEIYQLQFVNFGT